MKETSAEQGGAKERKTQECSAGEGSTEEGSAEEGGVEEGSAEEGGAEQHQNTSRSTVHDAHTVRHRLLWDTAFGDDPAGAWRRFGGVLPQPDSPRERWWRALAHAGFGYYDRAAAELAVLSRGGAYGPASGGDGRTERVPAGAEVWSSLAESMTGSLLRQTGRHGQAAVHDARALVLVETARTATAQHPRQHPGQHPGLPALLRHARADALTGLAADYLGRSDWRGAQRLLDTVEAELGGYGLGVGRAAETGQEPSPDGTARTESAAWGAAPPDPRLHLRLHWVRAETAMTAGDGKAAVSAVEAGLDMIAHGAVPSLRHRLKTRLIAAAAHAVDGDGARAAREAGEVAAQVRDAGLLPLQWAAWMLVAGVGPSTAERQRAGDEADGCAERLARRGGCMG